MPRYNETTERRILSKLDETPPSGYASWTGALVAEALGDVSQHQVWRVLRSEGIPLQRRRSWCIRTDPARSEVEGAGLGLSIAKWITETHRATLSVESWKGRGSVFQVAFPVLAAQPEKA